MVSQRYGRKGDRLDFLVAKTVCCTLYNDMVAFRNGRVDVCLDVVVAKIASCTICNDIVYPHLRCGRDYAYLSLSYMKTASHTLCIDMVSLQYERGDVYLDVLAA